VDRAKLLAEVETLRATLVMFESPRRLADSLKELEASLGSRRACVARELTKVHEEISRGTLAELAARYQGKEVLGEIAIVVEGRSEASRWSESEVCSAIAERIGRGEPLKELSRDLAAQSGWTARALYRLALSLRSP
jgi:16S rRNA (cytidine1402-2'-O)-methyltransferase